MDPKNKFLKTGIGNLGVEEREVDADGDDLRVVFLSILRRPLLLPLLWPPSLLSVVTYALSVSELSEERLGCHCTSWHRLSNPWLTITAFFPVLVLCGDL